MQFELTDEEMLALLNLLVETIEADKFPRSPRIRILLATLAKFGPMARRRRPRDRPPEECDPRRASCSRPRPARLDSPGGEIIFRAGSSRKIPNRQI